MNTKMKKVVAGVVLGTFTFGMATPAFAEVENMQETEVAVVSPVYVNDIPLAHSTTDSEFGTYGFKNLTLDGLKTALKVGWTKLTTIMVEHNVDAEIILMLNDLRDTFFDVLDVYFETSNTVREVVVKSFTALGLEEDTASFIADLILLFIL